MRALHPALGPETVSIAPKMCQGPPPWLWQSPHGRPAVPTSAGLRDGNGMYGKPYEPAVCGLDDSNLERPDLLQEHLGKMSR